MYPWLLLWCLPHTTVWCGNTHCHQTGWVVETLSCTCVSMYIVYGVVICSISTYLWRLSLSWWSVTSLPCSCMSTVMPYVALISRSFSFTVFTDWVAFAKIIQWKFYAGMAMYARGNRTAKIIHVWTAIHEIWNLSSAKIKRYKVISVLHACTSTYISLQNVFCSEWRGTGVWCCEFKGSVCHLSPWHTSRCSGFQLKWIQVGISFINCE